VVGLACLIDSLAEGAPLAVAVVSAAFLAYGLALAIFAWRRPEAGRALLTLVVDTIFFLLFAAYGADGAGWLISGVYFYLLSSSLLLHRWWDTWLIASVSILMLPFVPRPNAGAQWRVVFWTGLLACISARGRSVLLRRLDEASREAQQCRELALRSGEEEREKLAGDFHDGPLQGFISMHMRLEVLRRALERDPGAARRELEDLQQAARSHIDEMRVFLRGMRPVAVGEAGLAASLRQTVAEFQRHSSIKATFEADGAPPSPSEEASREVVQIAREALSNVQKHARATRVAVKLASSPDGGVELSVEDNGVGFSFAGAFRLEELERLRIGPASIEARVRNLGGELTVDSRPQQGSRLTVRVPA